MKRNWLMPAGITLMLSSFTVKPVESSSNVVGTWKGSLGNESKMIEAVVKLKPGRVVEFYEGMEKGSDKLVGTYRVLGDTALVLDVYKKGAQKRMTLHGNLNRSKSFVDGVWQEGNKEEGSFYLQKIQ